MPTASFVPIQSKQVHHYARFGFFWMQGGQVFGFWIRIGGCGFVTFMGVLGF
jgi:hypothetical protein